jgi:hypothetical protein
MDVKGTVMSTELLEVAADSRLTRRKIVMTGAACRGQLQDCRRIRLCRERQVPDLPFHLLGDQSLQLD